MSAGSRIRKSDSKFPSSCRGDFSGRGHRDPEATLLQLYNQLSGSSPPGTAGPPPPDCPSVYWSSTVSAGRQALGRQSGARPPPLRAKTHKCPKRAKQTISGLASPGAIGITNATHANCPPRVATRLFVGPARTAQHGRLASRQRRLESV